MTGAAKLHFRRATQNDLPFIIGLYEADDHANHHSKHGDHWSEGNRAHYEKAFAAITLNPRDALMIIEHRGEAVGTFLLTLLPGLTGRGATHLQLRAVQIRSDQRSQGIGAAMLAFVDAYAREHGATLIELMSNLTRTGAHRFYTRHGYSQSHAGFKKKLKETP